MPWGKHKGQDIEDLPSGYLRWLAEKCDDEAISEEADAEYRWREDHQDHH